MIDLDKPIKAREDRVVDFTPAPEGEYDLRVLEIAPWKETTYKTLGVIQRDERGNALKDEKGNYVRETVENVKIYNANVTFEIVGGEHEGKRVFHNLTTHPNMPFVIPSFLYGLGVDNLAASEIQEKCKGLLCRATIYVDSYIKEVTDKDTGLVSEETRESNKIRSFKKPKENNLNKIANNDLGI